MARTERKQWVFKFVFISVDMVVVVTVGLLKQKILQYCHKVALPKNQKQNRCKPELRSKILEETKLF